MATMAAAARDIPTTSGRDNLTAVAARSVPVARSHSHPLPTPPNSISPALPPHGLKAQLQKARLEPIDSDLDLQDRPSGHLTSNELLDSTTDDLMDIISPGMLAKIHLPDILLNHGPLAIRHIMGYLTTSVPGFAGIPPAKARRLVVGALEGRRGELVGMVDDVIFEKVGWGRWDARRVGVPSREVNGTFHAGGIPIGKGSGRAAGRTRLAAPGSSGGDGESAAYSHDDRDVTMNEADKMSMEGSGSGSASCSPAPDDDVAMNDDPADLTDDEDWAAVGAAALRASSYSNVTSTHNNRSLPSSRVYTSGHGWRYHSTSTGMARPPKGNFDFSASALAAASDAQEREAVEALLQLGSV